jgi:hypothetical protein
MARDSALSATAMALTNPKTADLPAEWAERSEKPKVGRTGHLTPEQRQEIRLAYFETGCKATRIELAERFGVNRETVAAILKGQEFEALRNQLHDELVADVSAKLKRFVPQAVDAWGVAIDEAAKKGDHKPAKDVLLHTDMIQPLRDSANPGLMITIGGTDVDINIGAQNALVIAPRTPASD